MIKITNCIKVFAGKNLQSFNKYYVVYDLLATEADSTKFLRKFDKHNATESEIADNKGNVKWKHTNRIE